MNRQVVDQRPVRWQFGTAQRARIVGQMQPAADRGGRPGALPTDPRLPEPARFGGEGPHVVKTAAFLDDSLGTRIGPPSRRQPEGTGLAGLRRSQGRHDAGPLEQAVWRQGAPAAVHDVLVHDGRPEQPAPMNGRLHGQETERVAVAHPPRQPEPRPRLRLVDGPGAEPAEVLDLPVAERVRPVGVLTSRRACPLRRRSNVAAHGDHIDDPTPGTSGEYHGSRPTPSPAR